MKYAVSFCLYKEEINESERKQLSKYIVGKMIKTHDIIQNYD